MGFAARHNKGAVFQCNTEGFGYYSLKELFDENGSDHVYALQGIYINRKSEYGDAPVAILEDRFANFPQHMLEECTDILKSQEDIDEIKAGKVGFRIEPYTKENKKGKLETFYGVRWVDLDE